MKTLVLFAAQFVFVGLKSVQQLNVTGGHYWWVPPTSMAMATCEVLVVWRIAQAGQASDLWSAIAVLGMAGGLGAIVGMFVHSKLGGAKS